MPLYGKYRDGGSGGKGGRATRSPDIYVNNAVRRGEKKALTDFPIHTIFEIRFLKLNFWKYQNYPCLICILLSTKLPVLWIST
jgi:hypothetical protein